MYKPDHKIIKHHIKSMGFEFNSFNSVPNNKLYTQLRIYNPKNGMMANLFIITKHRKTKLINDKL